MPCGRARLPQVLAGLSTWKVEGTPANPGAQGESESFPLSIITPQLLFCTVPYRTALHTCTCLPVACPLRQALPVASSTACSSLSFHLYLSLPLYPALVALLAGIIISRSLITARPASSPPRLVALLTSFCPGTRAQAAVQASTPAQPARFSRATKPSWHPSSGSRCFAQELV